MGIGPGCVGMSVQRPPAEALVLRTLTLRRVDPGHTRRGNLVKAVLVVLAERYRPDGPGSVNTAA